MLLPLAEIPQSCYVIFPRWRFEVSGLSGLWQYLRWVDDGSVGGDDDADDGEGLSAVRAVVVSARSGDVVRERTGDGGAGVTGHDGRGLQVAAADHLEQRGVRFGVWVVPGVGELIDHEQPWAAEEPHRGRPPAFERGAFAAFGQIGGGGEVDPMPHADRGPGEADGDHRLPGAGLADEQHVACLLYTSDAADEEDSVDLGGRRI